MRLTYRLMAVFSVLVLLGACSTEPADANGRWEGEATGTNGGGAVVIMNLSQAGTVVSGSVFAGAISSNVRGEMRGSSFSLVSIDNFAPESTMVVDGSISGDSMTGSVSYTQFGQSRITYNLQRVR